MLGFQVSMLPMLLLYTMHGSPWQSEVLLLAAGAFVALVPLCDPRPIIFCSALLCVQHAILAVFAPHWIGFETASLGQSVMRLSAIVGGGVLLCWLTRCLSDAFDKAEELSAQNEANEKALKAHTEALEEARTQLDHEKIQSAERETRAHERRKEEYDAVATEFEHSINVVTQSVASTAELLEHSAHQLKLTADSAGDEARHLVGSAETTSRAANTVAAGVAELSMSIAEVADNADQQSNLSLEATECSGGGGKAIQILTEQSRTIGEATRSIVRIAERTNLLSLNAAIEAASAGPSGRGFSIVAHEVKQLASQASDAATRIEAFLDRVQKGTFEAERSFEAIDSAIGKLGQNANTIRYDIENQRQSADTIESFARHAAGDSDRMVERSRALAERAAQSKLLSCELERAAADLAQNARHLESSSQSFRSKLKSA